MLSIHRIVEVFGQGHSIQIGKLNLLPGMQTINHGNPKNLFGLNTHRQSTL